MIRAYLRQHHVGLIALLLVLLSGGSAYAAATIGAGDIKKNAVRAKHIKDGVVSGADVNEASLDVSRVMNRGLGGTDQDLLTLLPADSVPYPLDQGANWTQAANETLIGVVGKLTYDKQNCSFAGVPNINMLVKIGDEVVGFIAVPIGGGAPSGSQTATFTSLPLLKTLFEPGAATPRTLGVLVSKQSTCNSGGPVKMQDLAISLVGVR